MSRERNAKVESHDKSSCYTEGFIKTLATGAGTTSFRIEATAPYLFEIKLNGKDEPSKRRVLLVDAQEEIAHIADEDYMFTTRDKTDFANLLIVKANHMKVRLTIELKDGKLPEKSCPIVSFEVK